MDSIHMYRPHTYQPLLYRRAIRVLELLPGNDGNPIQCRLRRELLNDGPNYEAVSYVWGKSGSRTIVIMPNEAVTKDGRTPKATTIQIPRNLHTALLHLRYDDESRFLWADAACIDQINLRERGRQVEIMKEIYERASRVVIWLNVQDEYTETTLGFLLALDRLDEDRPVEHMPENVLARHFRENDILTDSYSCVYDPNVLRDATRLFMRPWFRRVWVCQEATSSHRVIVRIGHRAVLWRKVTLAAVWLDKCEIQGLTPWVKESYFRRASFRNAMTMGYCFLPMRFSFLSLIHESRRYEATDPRDKIYAFMGMSPFQVVLPNYQPNYEKAVEQVYTEFALRVILRTRKVNIFSFVEHKTVITPNHISLAFHRDMPSWVPAWDFKSEHHNRPFATSAWFNDTTDSIVRMRRGRLKALLAQKSPRITLPGLPVSDVYSLAGFLHWDIVDGFGNCVVGFERLARFWTHLREQQAYVAAEGPRNPSDRVLSEVETARLLARVMTCGMGRINEPVDFSDDQHLSNFVSFVKRQLPAQKLIASELSDLYKRIAAVESAVELPPGDALLFAETALFHGTNRRMFSKSDGTPCLGPSHALVGDGVVVFFGSNLPFMLRPCFNDTDDYDGNVLLGECYVENMMYGEAFEAYDSGQQAEEYYELR